MEYNCGEYSEINVTDEYGQPEDALDLGI